MNPLRADRISPLDIFKIGVGPSSSHTVGPMLAASDCRQKLISFLSARGEQGQLHLEVELFGSLSFTGRGHLTDKAVCAGLIGLNPKTAAIEEIWKAMPVLEENGEFDCQGSTVTFHPGEDIKWQAWLIDGNHLPHPNTIRFRLLKNRHPVWQQIIVSLGGGFIESVDLSTGQRISRDREVDCPKLPFPFNSAAELVAQCHSHDIAPWQIVIANERSRGLDETALRIYLKEILETFEQCIERGLNSQGVLPGGLNLKRRAKALFEQLQRNRFPDFARADLRPSIYAIAVSEENAAGGKVVTAPTNGSAGLIPAVWRTLRETNSLSEEVLENGLMVSSVIAALVKTHASISGAEVGCQGEVGTACAMAAAGATAMLGGTANQIEQAAEIGIEHHLGMTCDPILGLVQVPCIERNAMGSVQALNAAFLSLASDGSHVVSLDRALSVMKQTGLDMNQKYKETATGGLALG